MAATTTLYLYWIALLWTICCKGQSICPKDNETNSCCSGYRKINGSCTACIGFIGQNCENICPSSNYGSFCRHTCNCTHDQICNRYVGCLPKKMLKNSCKLMHNNSDLEPDFDIRGESCNLLLYLVIGLAGSHLIILILCLATLCLKCCRLSQHRTKASNDNSYMRELHAGKEMNQISLEGETAIGDHYHTRDLWGSSTFYDTSATADRFKKHADQNWTASNRCDVPDFPSDNLHDVRNTTPVNSHATQSSSRPYSLQHL